MRGNCHLALLQPDFVSQLSQNSSGISAFHYKEFFLWLGYYKIFHSHKYNKHDHSVTQRI